MAAAKYTIHVPSHDELGQPLRLHEAVRKHFDSLGADAVQLHLGSPSHTVAGWVEDTPEWDSRAKQIGTQAGEVANVPVVHVTKEGDKSASWQMHNPHYRAGEGGNPSAVTMPIPSSIHAQLTGNK